MNNYGMIEFKGLVSEEARLDRMKRVRKPLLAFISVLAALIAVGITLTLIYNSYEWLDLLAPAFMVLFVVTLLTFNPNKYNRLCYPTYLCNEITITVSDGVISHSYFKKEKPVDSVKKIIDAGDWYYVVFRYGDIGNSWVCQKDLITEGNIEQFEELFEGKIVK